MTINEFQETLKEGLLDVFKDIRGKIPNGTVAGIKGYSQSLPVVDNDDENDSRFPYFIVRLADGEDDDLYSIRGMVKTLILFGVYDDSKDNQGHKTILNLIQRYRERFGKNPLVGGQYRMRSKIKWVLQDEDTYPFFFGGIESEWDIKKFRKEDPYS